jgi:hypothetical protein
MLPIKVKLTVQNSNFNPTFYNVSTGTNSTFERPKTIFYETYLDLKNMPYKK